MSINSPFIFTDEKRDLHRHLHEMIKKEKNRFLELAQAFDNKKHRTCEHALFLLDNIIEALNNVLNAGNWNSSLMLKNIAKQLHELLDEAQTTRIKLQQRRGLEKIVAYELRENEIQLYVSLYQTDGHNLAQWAYQLASIDQYMIGRPVYQSEEDVKRAIRCKLSQTSEAYAVVVIDANKIVPNELGQEKVDRHGFPLVTIRQGQVQALNIIEFVHLDVRYHYRNQQLIAKT